MTKKVLVGDKLHEKAIEILENDGFEVDIKTGLSEEELTAIVDNYDGLIVRSKCKPTATVLKNTSNLKVIGRAGVGVDNIDLVTATERNIVVMNTPFGNNVAAAEHTMGMMLSVLRKIPYANASMKKGLWEKPLFQGTEMFEKNLGVIGCGNIGKLVIKRAQGFEMNVLAYDPFLTEEQAKELNVTKVELNELFANADIITLHTPLLDATRGIINKENLAKCKQGAVIINCARGPLVVEEDLKEAISSGHIAGAGLDVFTVEPPENIFADMNEVVCTPHLGASTIEAQVNVAVQVAEQISDYLLNEKAINQVNK